MSPCVTRIACQTSVASNPLLLLLRLERICRKGFAIRGAGLLAMLLATGTLAIVTMAMGTVAGAQTATVAGPNWKQLSPATSPPARYGASMAYNPANGTMVLFGGTDVNYKLLGDTWTFDGTTWTQQFPANSPFPRTGATMVYAPNIGAILLYAGYELQPNGTQTLDDYYYTWDGTNWTNFPNGASFREFQAMTYDVAKAGVLVFGGAGNSGTLADTYLSSGSGGFAKQSPATSPSARSSATMSYSGTTGTAILFGGSDSTGHSLGDTWAYNGSNWVQQSPAASPGVRYGANSTYDPNTSNILLFGGYTPGTNFADTWAYNGTNWSQLSPLAAPSGRYYAVMAYNPATKTTLLFGGTNGGGTTTGDTWSYTSTSGVTAPTTPVGSAAAQTAVTFVIGTAGTLPALSNANVLTTGIAGLDFTLGTGSTCTGAVTAGQTCTVNVAFTPQAAGLRKGAVNLLNSSGTVLATAFLSGTGTGPLLDFSTATYQSIDASAEGNPLGVTVDAANNLYIAARYGVEKGAAGSNSASAYANSPINCPLQDIAIDGSGSLYVTCQQTAHFFKVVGGTFTQPVTTTLNAPSGIVTDGVGNVFFADQGSNTIYEVTPGATTATVVVPSTGGLNAPKGLALDNAGGLYVADSGNNVVKYIAAGAAVATVVPTPGLSLNAPSGLAVDAAGNLLIDDYQNNRIVEVPAGGGTAFVMAAQSGALYMALDSQGRLNVASQGSDSVLQFDRTTAAVAFPATPFGTSSAPVTVQRENDGNAPTTFATPSSGVNPALTGPYVLGNGGSCPQISSMGAPQTLAAGAFCTDVLTFHPATVSASNPGTLTTTDNSNNAVSTHVVTLSGAGTQTPQTITFPQPPSPAAPGTTATLTATASSGLAVTYSITSGPATVSGSTVTYTGAGMVVIAANQAGNAQYAPAPTVSDTVTTMQQAQTITFPQPATPAPAGTSAALTASASSGLPVTYTVTSGPATISGATVTYTGLGTVVIAASQAGNTSYGAATTVSDTVAVTAPVEPVGTMSSTITASVKITTAGTPATIKVVTQGSTVLDYVYVSGGSCSTSTAYAVNSVCTVEYTFKPQAPGQRAGAIVLANSAGTVLSTTLHSSTGTGPLLLFQPTVASSNATLSGGSGLSVDATGNVYAASSNYPNNYVVKIAPGATTATTLVSGQVAEATAVDGAGNVYFDTSYNSSGTAIFELVGGTGTPVQVATFTTDSPDSSLGIDAAGNLYVPGYSTGAIFEIAAGTRAVTTILAGGANHRFAGLTSDPAGNIFVVDQLTNYLYRLASGSGVLTTLASGAPLNSPDSVSLDAAGNVYVANNGRTSVLRYSPANYAAPLSLAENAGEVAIGPNGNLYAYVSTASKLYTYPRATAPALTFPSTALNATSAAQSVTVENDGNAALTFTSIAPSTSNFGFAGGVANGSIAGCGGTLATGALCNISATFTPQSTGAQSATGNVTDNSLNVAGALQTVALSGTATLGSQTITFPQPPSQPAGSSYTLTATSSSGNPVTYTLTSGPATLSGAVVSYTGVGNVVIAANSAATASYNAAPTVTDTVTTTTPASTVGVTSGTLTATLTFVTAGTPAVIGVYTQGVSGLDFNMVSGGTCSTTTAYAVGAMCTVNYSFTPRAPGQRLGAVELLSSGSAAVLATTLVSGIGNAAETVFPGSSVPRILSSAFNAPAGVTVDAAGNVFVADFNNNAIKEIMAVNGSIPASPTVRTVYNNLANPYATAVDGAGNLYVADTFANNVVELPAVAGVVQTNATVRTLGSGFAYPEGVAVDAAGNVFVGDFGNNAVKELVAVNGSIPATSPTIRTLGSGFNSPEGIAVDLSGNVYVGDSGNKAVKELVAVGGSVPASPTIRTLGSGFTLPYGVAVDAAGDVYVSDATANTVTELVAVNGSVPATSPTQQTIGSGYSSPTGVAVDGFGNVFVADGNNNEAKEVSFVNPPSVTFTAGTTVNTTSSDSPKSVLLQNVGNQSLSLATAITTNFSLVAASSSPCGTTLATGALCNVGVSFTPATYGSLTGTLTLTDNNLSASQNVAQTSALSGTATGLTKTITFPQPPSQNAGTSYTLNATASNGDPVGYVITSGSATLSGSVVTYTGSGSVVIQAYSTATATYYAAQSVSDTVTVTANTKTITFPQPPSQAAGTSYTLAATASNGDPVTYSITSGPATVSGSVVTYTGAGTVVIAANSAATSTYNAAPTVSDTVMTTVGNKTITFPQPPNQLANTSYTLTATSSSGDPVTYTLVSGPATLSGSVVTYTAVGTVVLAANSAATASYNAAATVTDTVMVEPASTYTAPTTAVGTTSATQTAYVVFTSAGTPAVIGAYTQGVAGLDYALVTGGTCSTTTAYTVGQSCSVNYTFTPRAPGVRLGAIELLNAGSTTVLGTSLLTGSGTGGAVVYPSTASSRSLGSGFSNTNGVAVDAAGNVYLTAYGTNTLQKILAVNGSIPATNPTILTLGSGLNGPGAVAVDGAGNVYVQDQSTTPVKEFVAVGGAVPPNPATVTVRALGSGFNFPSGLAVDGAGNVYVADNNNNAIKKLVAVNGVVPSSPTIQTLGSGFYRPTGVAVDAAGNVFVADQGDSQVKEIAAVGGSIRVLGSGFNYPFSVQVDAAGDVYVDDEYNKAIKEIVAVGGNIPTSSPTIRTLATSSAVLTGLSLDSAGNVFYVANSGTSVFEVPLATPAPLSFATTAAGSTSTDSPKSVALQNIGNAALLYAPTTTTTSFTAAASSCGSTLATSASCTMMVSFTPTAGGALSDVLSAVSPSSPAGNLSQPVALSGMGTVSQPTVSGISPATGATAGGTAVTITGTNLVGTTSVTFGSAAALSFSVNSNTSITATSPAGTGTVDIAVNNSNYTSPTSAADQFTYLGAQTINFPQPATPAGTHTSATLTATASSGLAVTYTITSGPATISGSTVTFTGAGAVVIAADQAGNSSYTAAPEVTRTVLAQTQSIFVTNSAGSVSSFYDDGGVQKTAVSGGGIGAAVDPAGFVFSLYANGNGIYEYSDDGTQYNLYNGYGASAATALAIDGRGLVYFTNGNGTVDALDKIKGTVYSVPIAAAAGISSPTAVSIDSAGSLWIASSGDNSAVEIIGVAAPVVTPTVNAVKNANPGTRP